MLPEFPLGYLYTFVPSGPPFRLRDCILGHASIILWTHNLLLNPSQMRCCYLPYMNSIYLKMIDLRMTSWNLSIITTDIAQIMTVIQGLKSCGNKGLGK